MANETKVDLAKMLGEQLHNLTKEVGATPATTATEQEKETQKFTGTEEAAKPKKIPVDANGVPYIKGEDGEYRPRTEEEITDWKAAQELREKKDSVSKTLMSASQAVVGELEREVRELIASRLRIIGYICAKGDKIDFAASGKIIPGAVDKENKPKKDYTITLKNSAPSSIQYVIIKEPTPLIMFKENLADMDKAKAYEQFNIFKNTPAQEESFSIKYIAWEDMIAYVMAKTNGVIHEDPHIFTQYVKGSASGKQAAKIYSTPADIKAHNGIPAGSCLYLFAKLAKVKFLKNKEGQPTDVIDTKSVVTLKHSVRSKIITPANVIPLKRFQTITPATSYTAANANEMVRLYLSKFNSSTKNADDAVAKNLRDPQYFTTDGTGIIKSSYFAADGAQSWFANPANSVAHWADKNADGSAKQIAASDIKLVKKEDVPTKNGGTRQATLTEDLGAADSAAAYQFTAANFPKVFEAAGALKLDFDELSKAIADNKARRPKSSRAKDKKVTYVAPEALVGLSIDQIAEQLKKTFN